MRWLPLLLLLTTGCGSECRTLCAEWFDYQEDVCGVLDLNDERVSCIADYSARLVSDDETTECVQRRTELTTLTAEADSTTRQACCPDAEGDACPWQQDAVGAP